MTLFCWFFLFIYFIFIILNTKVPLRFQSSLEPIISDGSGEKVDFDVFAIFSNGDHLDLTLESYHTSSEI